MMDNHRIAATSPRHDLNRLDCSATKAVILNLHLHKSLDHQTIENRSCYEMTAQVRLLVR